MDFASLAGYGSHGITVQKTMNFDAPVERVFALWSDYERYPSFMRNVRRVERVGGNGWRWAVAGPGGVPVHWEAEIVAAQPNRLIRWRSTPESEVRHEGEVRFAENGNGGTRLNVQLSYLPPAGALGHAVAALFGADPKSEMDADLLRMKTLLETGKPPHDAARRTASL